MAIRRTQFLMTEADEDAFTRELASLRPDLLLIDGQVWPSAEPPLISSISLATHEVYLWSPSVAARLPTRPRPGGLVQGPQSGPVIQFERSFFVGDELRSGGLAVGYEDDDASTREFVDDAWKALRRTTTGGVVRPDGSAVSYRIGHHAAEWLRSSPSHRLRDRSVPLQLELRSK